MFLTPEEAIQAGKEALIYKIRQSISNCEFAIILNQFEYNFLQLEHNEIVKDLENSGWVVKFFKFYKSIGYTSAKSNSQMLFSSYYILSVTVSK